VSLATPLEQSELDTWLDDWSRGILPEVVHAEALI